MEKLKVLSRKILLELLKMPKIECLGPPLETLI